MGLPSYEAKQQYDSHECLCILLDKVFLDNEESFKLQARQNTSCDNTGCFHNSEGITYERTLTLNIEQTYDCQSVNKILLRSMFRHHLPDYRCEGCQNDDQISKGARLFSLSSDGTVPYILIYKNIITQHRIEVSPSRDSTIRLNDNYGVSSETCFNLSKSSSLN